MQDEVNILSWDTLLESFTQSVNYHGGTILTLSTCAKIQTMKTLFLIEVISEACVKS